VLLLLLPVLSAVLSALLRGRLTRLLFPPTSTFRRVRNVLYHYGIADTIGRRAYMEDRHVAAGELRGDPLASVYAVFDGHAGHAAAEFCVQRLVHLLVNDEAFPAAPAQAIANAFVRTDEEVRRLRAAAARRPGAISLVAPLRDVVGDGLPAETGGGWRPQHTLRLASSFCVLQFLAHARSCRPPLDDGTTAVAALVMRDVLYVANGARCRRRCSQGRGPTPPLHRVLSCFQHPRALPASPSAPLMDCSGRLARRAHPTRRPRNAYERRPQAQPPRRDAADQAGELSCARPGRADGGSLRAS
jgi:hypothetical protein